jgi:tetratricopeptide (TPR) repeat protein
MVAFGQPDFAVGPLPLPPNPELPLAPKLARRVFFRPEVEGREPAEAVDPDVIQLRELGQKHFFKASYELMGTTYSVLGSLPSSSRDDAMWLGHAHQLARNWPAAIKAYQKALTQLDAEIAAVDARVKEIDDPANQTKFEQIGKMNERLLFKRAQEILPKQWPDLVLQIGLMELFELKDPAAAATTLSKGLRYAPELSLPFDQMLAAAELALSKSPPVINHFKANELIVPIETLRFLAMAQEQLEQPAAAFDTWVRVRLAQIQYQSYYATTNSAHLKELASKFPPNTLQSHHQLALKNPDREPLKQREARDFLKSVDANPFRSSPLKGLDFAAHVGSANLARLRDGRLLVAYTTADHHQARIKLSLSKDGIEWEVPWEFAHNSVFQTRAPSLVVDDFGEIWMLCLSQRLTTQRFASRPYQLWLTHSHDGRDWAPLRILQMTSETGRLETSDSQYQELPELMRLPGGRFGILWRNQFAEGKTPNDLSELKALKLPHLNEISVVSNTQAAFDANGRCHLVFDDFGRGIYYTRSDDMQTWLPLQLITLAQPNSRISRAQILIQGDRAALIYEQNNGSWLQCGNIAAAGLELGQALQIADHTMPLNGARLFVDGDLVRIPAGAEPYVPNLFTAKLADLLKQPDAN